MRDLSDVISDLRDVVPSDESDLHAHLGEAARIANVIKHGAGGC